MGTGYTYTCGCKAPQPLMIGIGRQTPKRCSETWSDMMKGKYGEMWKRAVTMHPNGGLDCSQEIYVCDCGHWERDTRRTLWEKGDKNHCKSALPRNRAIKPCYHVCPDCGKRMRIADFENDRLTCPECGEEMRDFKPNIMWE